MAEEQKVRLVRCAKCQSLLREPPDFSVYQCGGCGALLRAKKKLAVNEGPLKKLENDKDGQGFEQLQSLPQNGDYLEIKSANKKELKGDFLNNRKDSAFKQKNYNLFSSNSLLEIQNRETSIDNKEILGYNGKYRMPLKQPIGSFVDDHMNMNRSKSVYSNRGKFSAQFEESAESLIRSKGIISNWDSDVDSNRMTNSRSRLPGFAYHSDVANGKRFAHLERDRAELLRKLDELKEQICLNGSVNHVERLAYFRQYGEEMEMKKFYSHREYIDFNREQFVPHSRSLYHRPACSCINCCNTNQHDPLMRIMANRSALPLKDAKSGSRWPSDYIDSNIDMFCLGKAAVAHRNARFCHPMVGGSPFIACCSCSEVIKVPRNLIPRGKNQCKLQCGVCSTILSLETKSKRLIISIPVEKADGDGTFATVSKEVPLMPDGGLCIKEAKCSVDSEDWRQNLSISETIQELATQSYVSLGDEDNNSQDSIVIESEFSYVCEPQTKDNASSNLEENRNENTSLKNSVKNVALETEMEVSLNECLTSDLSQDSTEGSTSKDDQLGTNKGSGSFLVGLVKRSLRDFSRSNQHTDDEKPAVFVNGQPIPDHIVKKVEKLAGLIQPGDYWYDFQAGFWGVMGRRCLGIIPPFIKEFNYPMTRNCAAGNTNIFVNGRELDQKDLELLASRGLPTTKDKFYIIEISGRVFDKESGLELSSLGKLAPTVEKQKRGFGMKVPRSWEK